MRVNFLICLLERLKKWDERGTKDGRKVNFSPQGYMGDSELVYREMKKAGFRHPSEPIHQATYYLEPFWGIDGIKNEELRNYLNKSEG